MKNALPSSSSHAQLPVKSLRLTQPKPTSKPSEYKLVSVNQIVVPPGPPQEAGDISDLLPEEESTTHPNNLLENNYLKKVLQG
jgi:hypothetical protein